MTNSPTPFPQWQPIQFNQGNGQDLFFGGARSALRREPRPRNDFRVVSRQPEQDEHGWHVKWIMTIRDLSGGAGKYQGPFDLFSNRYSDAYGIDASYPGYLMLGQLLSSATGPDPTGNLVGLHWENIFDTLIWGIGSGTDVSLIKETSATNPTPTAITYNPTNSAGIIHMSRCVLGSADERLLVGLSGEPAQLIGDASGTVDATLHSDLTTLWGHVQTSLPSTATPGASMHLFYAGTSMFNDLDTASATSANPTATLTALPQGGYTIKPGEFALSDGPRRAWFVLPKETNTSGMLLFGSEKLGYVFHFSPDGQEFQKLDFNNFPNGLLIASHGVSPTHGSCIAASDGKHVVIHNGDIEEDLHIFTEALGGASFASIDSNWYYRCRGLGWQGEDLYARVNLIDSSGTGTTYHYMWKYDWEVKAWHIVGGIEAMGTGNTLKGPVAAGGEPISYQTGFYQTYTATNWLRAFLVPPAENPYLLHRLTQGTTSGKEYEFQGEIFMSRLTLPGLEGYPSHVDWARSLGNLRDYLATDSGSLTLHFAIDTGDGPDYAAQFDLKLSGMNRLEQRIAFNQTNELFYAFSMSILMVRTNTSTRVTGQALPIIIGGRTYIDGYKP